MAQTGHWGGYDAVERRTDTQPEITVESHGRGAGGLHGACVCGDRGKIE